MSEKKTTKNGSSTGVATKNQFSSANVPNLLEELKQRLESLEVEKGQSFSLDIVYDASEENIKDIKKVSRLIEIYSGVKSRGLAFKEAGEELGIDLTKVKEFTISGKTVEEWKIIIQKAYSKLTSSREIEKLKLAIKEMEECLSEEDKIAMKIRKITQFADEKFD